MQLSLLHVVGLLATIALIVGIGFYSGKKVSSAADFSGGSAKAGPWIVCGAIMGTLVSGQATVGTAQLAFSYGMSAWWFTLGSGIGCLILALGFALPYRRSGCTTLMQIVSKEYGPRAESLGSVFCSIGIFISYRPADHHLPSEPSGRRLDLHPADGLLCRLWRDVGRGDGRCG